MYQNPVIIDKRQPLGFNDSPSGLELVTLTLTIGREPSFGAIRRAIRAMGDYVCDYVRVEYSPGPYDCTGQSYTTGLDRLKRFLWNSSDGAVLIAVYTHQISIDC